MRNYLEYEKIEDFKSDVKLLFGENNETRTFTYIITTFNRFDLLKRCVNSILNQSERDEFSIIVVDNNASTIQDYETNPDKYMYLEQNQIIYYVNEKNVGGATSANHGVLLAKSKYISLIHDDDIIHSKHYFYLKKIMEKYSDIKYVSVGLQKVYFSKNQDECFLNKKVTDKNIKKISLSKLYRNYFCPMLGALIDRKAFLEVGGIGNLSNMEDYIFTYKICEKYSGFIADNKLYGYSILENDSLNDSIWNDILVEQYYLRKYIKKNHKLFTIPNSFLLARDIAYYESNCCIKKMELNKKYILKNTNTPFFLMILLVFICKVLFSIKQLIRR